MAIMISRRTVLIGVIVAWPVLVRALGGGDPAAEVDTSSIVSSIPAGPAAIHQTVPREGLPAGLPVTMESAYPGPLADLLETAERALHALMD